MKRTLLILTLTCFLFEACGQTDKARKYYGQASAEFEFGEYQKALQLANKAIKADKKYSDPWDLKAQIYEKLGDSTNALKSYLACIKAEPLKQDNYFYYAQYLHKLGQYDRALAQLDIFDKVPAMTGFNLKKNGSGKRVKDEAEKLRTSCHFAKEESARISELHIENVGYGINSKYRDYWPGMTIDGKYFIYTRLLQGQEDFYISRRVDTGWQLSTPLPGNINTPENEGTSSVTADGRYIFFTVCNQDGFGSCDIYYSYYDAAKNAWGRRMNLGPKVNTASWEAHPSIGADGKTLIFASNRPGGFGGMDLYVTYFVNGSWTLPENLGNTVNTAEDDEAPFLHYDGKTLYFASNGHTGMGGQDLFVTRKSADGTWTKPANLGLGINTTSDEVGLYVEYGGTKAYFTSDRPGGFGALDIYSFNLAPDKRPGPISYVLGKVIDEETGKELRGRIEVIDLASKNKVLKDSNYSFFTTLEPGGNYGLNVYTKGYLFYSANFQPTAGKIDSPFLVTARLKAIRNDQRIVLNNIFFDVDKFDLKPESYTELETVLQLMQTNPNMKIEIEGHTDNTGTDDHNKTLSENRAKAVQVYLIGKGIAANRITFKGYGSSQPVADNNTDHGRALNRRIEMRVTGL